MPCALFYLVDICYQFPLVPCIHAVENRNTVSIGFGQQSIQIRIGASNCFVAIVVEPGLGHKTLTQYTFKVPVMLVGETMPCGIVFKRIGFYIMVNDSHKG